MKITIIIQIQSTARSSIIKINIGSFKKRGEGKGKKLRRKGKKEGRGKRGEARVSFPLISSLKG